MLLLALLISIIISCKNIDNDDLKQNFMKEYFNTLGIDGTVIVHSLKTKTEYVYNDKRSRKMFLPASTFKIPHTLIALEEGAIANVTDIIKWNGKNHDYKTWNQDQTLPSAIKNSCVWVFQGFTKKISEAKYREYLKKMDYGNMQTGNDLSLFWLEGDLRISAREQISFLQKLYREELPFSKKNIQYLKRNLVNDKTDSYTLYGKTGLTLRVKEPVGWYVGYVETKNDVWFFAVNISPKDKNDYPLRKEIAYQALYELDVISKKIN